jgi:hypothetical protein
METVKLQYLSNGKWIDVNEWGSEQMAWISLGGDDHNYRTINAETGETLTDKSI